MPGVEAIPTLSHQWKALVRDPATGVETVSGDPLSFDRFRLLRESKKMIVRGIPVFVDVEYQPTAPFADLVRRIFDVVAPQTSIVAYGLAAKTYWGAVLPDHPDALIQRGRACIRAKGRHWKGIVDRVSALAVDCYLIPNPNEDWETRFLNWTKMVEASVGITVEEMIPRFVLTIWHRIHGGGLGPTGEAGGLKHGDLIPLPIWRRMLEWLRKRFPSIDVYWWGAMVGENIVNPKLSRYTDEPLAEIQPYYLAACEIFGIVPWRVEYRAA